MNKKTIKKGFSIVELVVALAILAILAGILVPRYQNSVRKSREKADAAAIDILVSATKSAIQDTSAQSSNQSGDSANPVNIYNLCKNAAAQSTSKEVVVEFYVANGIVYPTLLNCTIDNKNNVEIRDHLVRLVGSQTEAITLQSDLYKTYKFTIAFTFPDVEMKVNSKLTTSEKTFLSGDVDNDGSVTATDQSKLHQYVLNKQNEHTLNLAAGDLNIDGKIDSTDKTILEKHITNASEAYAILPYVPTTS